MYKVIYVVGNRFKIAKVPDTKAFSTKSAADLIKMLHDDCYICRSEEIA